MRSATLNSTPDRMTIRQLANPQLIYINLSQCAEFIDQKEILYCKSDGSYTCFNLIDNSTILTSNSLKSVQMKLNQDFIRVHQSFVVNKRWIAQYFNQNKNYLVLISGEKIPVSRSNKRTFLDHFDRI